MNMILGLYFDRIITSAATDAQSFGSLFPKLLRVPASHFKHTLQ